MKLFVCLLDITRNRRHLFLNISEISVFFVIEFVRGLVFKCYKQSVDLIVL